MQYSQRLEKIGLDRLKKHLLAKSVGLIDHPKSQWKWALRNMRKANPKGVKNAPLMQSGKELSDTKIRMGKLPNNSKQKILGEHRKQKSRFETGLTTKGKVVPGGDGYVEMPDNATLRAHTHPDVAINAIRTDKKSYHPEEVGRLFDKTLHASPSGINWDYNYNKGPFIRQEARKLSNIENVLNRMQREFNQRKYFGSYGTPLDRSRAKRVLPIFSKLEKKRDSLYDFLSDSNARRHLGTPTTGLGGDMSVFEDLRNKQSILSKGVEGVHQYRGKLPNALRSVYFKGGLN